MNIVGLSMEPRADFRRFPGGKNSQLFEELDRRYGVEAVHRPALSAARRTLYQLAAVYPDRVTWRRRFNLHPRSFVARTARARRLLEGSSARLIVQVHTLMGSGDGRPYVLHADTNYRLTERYYPEGAPLRGRARERFLALETEVYRGAAALFPRSAWMGRSLVEDYGCEPSRVVIVGGGNNVPLLPLEERRWDQRTALFVGLEWVRKGGPVLLAAWERVVAALPDARLVVVGVPKRPRGLPPGVEWLGVVEDRQRMGALFRQASVFVMPSIFEPWGNVFLEAMASGIPCVGTDVCAMPEIILHDRTGLVVPRRSVEPLAQGLIRLLADAPAAEAMGRAGQERIREGWSWDAVVQRMAPAIDAVLEG
jgi:glycosyltransferase involved in cell wall biosynthesis